MATSSVGVMAMDRVSSTRAKRDHFRFRKPLREKTTKSEKNEQWNYPKPLCPQTSINTETKIHTDGLIRLLEIRDSL